MLRWVPGPPRGVPMTVVGLDVARGGKDDTVIATRYGGWYGSLTAKAGIDTKDGPTVAALVFSIKRDAAPVVIDMGGGWGGSPLDHLKQNGVVVIGYVGSSASRRRTTDGKLAFANKRAETWWRFREALDPHQRNGSQVMLPDDPMLMADLSAPRWKMVSRGIQIEDKDEIRERLGRSPDKGDAVTMCWHDGEAAAEKMRVDYVLSHDVRNSRARLGYANRKSYARR
jgi:hypothetical protein